MYSINIKTKQKLTDVSKSLYGLFFEDINRAGDGGLYAELLRNRAFDDGIIPQGCKYDAANKLITSETGWTSSFDCYEGEGIAAWECCDGAVMKLTDKGTLNSNRRRALEVNFNGGMITNDGFMGVPVTTHYQFNKRRYRANPLTSPTNKPPQMLCKCGGLLYNYSSSFL